MLHWYTKIKNEAGYGQVFLSPYNQNLLPNDTSHWNTSGESVCIDSSSLTDHQVTDIYDRYMSMVNGKIEQTNSGKDIIINKCNDSNTDSNSCTISLEIDISVISVNTGYQDVVGYYVYPFFNGICKPNYTNEHGTVCVLSREILDQMDKKFVDNYYDTNTICHDPLYRTILFPCIGGKDERSNKTIRVIVPDIYRNNPNNFHGFNQCVGIGFFVIPNGWSLINRSDKSRTEYLEMLKRIIYSDSDLNYNSVIQSGFFYDEKLSYQNINRILIAFKDVPIPEQNDDKSSHHRLVRHSEYFTDIILYATCRNVNSCSEDLCGLNKISIIKNDYEELISNIILYPIVDHSSFNIDCRGFYIVLKKGDINCVRNIHNLHDGHVMIHHFIQLEDKENSKKLYNVIMKLFSGEKHSKIILSGSTIRISVPLHKMMFAKKYYLMINPVKTENDNIRSAKLYKLFIRIYKSKNGIKEWIDISHEPYKKVLFQLENNGSYRIVFKEDDCKNFYKKTIVLSEKNSEDKQKTQEKVESDNESSKSDISHESDISRHSSDEESEKHENKHHSDPHEHDKSVLPEKNDTEHHSNHHARIQNIIPDIKQSPSKDMGYMFLLEKYIPHIILGFLLLFVFKFLIVLFK